MNSGTAHGPRPGGVLADVRDGRRPADRPVR